MCDCKHSETRTPPHEDDNSLKTPEKKNEEEKMETVSEASTPCIDTHPWRTFSFEECAKSRRFAYLADPKILRGYSLQRRRRDVILSLFAWHNETVNVWSHLIGGILFIALFVSWLRHHYFSPESNFFTNNSSSSALPSSSVDSSAATSVPTVSVVDSAVTEFSTSAANAASAAFRSLRDSNPLFLLLSPPSTQAMSRAKEWLERVMLEHPPEKIAAALSSKVANLTADATTFLANEREMLENFIRAAAKKSSDNLLEGRRTMESYLESLSAGEAPAGVADAIRHLALVQWLENLTADVNARRTVLTNMMMRGASSKMQNAVLGFKSWLMYAEHGACSVDHLLAVLKSPAPVEVWPVLVFCFGGFMCLFCSAVYHWWVGYNVHIHNFFCRVDLGGISFMIWGSVVPMIYYTFYDDVFTMRVYLTLSTVFCAATLFFTMLPADVLHRVKRARVMSYQLAGSFAIAPLVHAVLRWGTASPQVARYTDDGNFFIVGLLYMVGAVIYISRFPENLVPMRFDFLFASHQIWHFMVFAAALVHYHGVVALYNWRVEVEYTNLMTRLMSQVSPAVTMETAASMVAANTTNVAGGSCS